MKQLDVINIISRSSSELSAYCH